MKLHLPIILLTALMAVMTTLPTYGNVSLTHDGTPQDEWDGRIDKKYKGTVEIKVDNEGSIKEVVCGQQGGTADGNTTITVSGEGASFRFDTPEYSGQEIGYGETESSALEINLLDHAKFTLGKANLGKGSWGSTIAPIKTLINVNGGSLFDMDGTNSAGSIGSFANEKATDTGEVAVTINVDGNGSVFKQTNGKVGSCHEFNNKYKQTSTTNINVTGGGQFVFTTAGSSQANIGRSEGKESLSTVNILVEGESSLFDMYCNGMADCAIGQTSMHSSGGVNTSKITIDVKDGACFRLKELSTVNARTVIGRVGRDDGSLAEVELNIGDLTLAETDAKKAQFLMMADNNEKVGTLIGYTEQGKTITTINIGNGGSLVMQTKGSVGQATTTTSSAEKSSHAEVHISMIGNASLTMEPAGTDDTDSNLVIGYANYGSFPEKEVSTTVEITMAGTSEFTLNTGGCIGRAQLQYPDKGGVVSAAVSIELKDNAHFLWVGGTIGSSTETSSTSIVLRGESELTRTATSALSGGVTLYDGATYSTGSGHSSDQAITMRGGNLADASNYVGNSVVIDIDGAFSGAMKMGGLSADKVTSFKANGQEVRLEDLGSGTLRLSGGDRIKLGKESAWVKDSVQGDGQRHALFEFTGDSGGVEVDTDEERSNFYLDFKAGDLDFSSDDRITVEVWITNGTSRELEADDFKVGEGWGLRVEQYDAESGKLILTGRQNVWYAKRDGDPGEIDRAEGVASELESYDKVVIDENTTLNADADATVKQLQGDEGANLEIANDSDVERQITFYCQNGTESPSDHSGDTIFEGDISAGPNVNLNKTGDADLTIEGNLNAKGDVTVDKGALVLGDASESSIDGKLTLGDGGTLEVDGELTVSGGISGESQGSITGSGMVVLDGGEVTFGKDLQVDGTLTFKMEGNANVTSEGDRHVTITGGDKPYSGELAGLFDVEGDFAMNGSKSRDSHLTMQKGSTLDLTQGGNNTLGSVKSAYDAGATYKLRDTSTGNKIEDFVIHTEDTVDIGLHLDEEAFWGEGGGIENPGMLTCTGTLVIEDGATFKIHNLSDIIAEHSGKSLKGIIIMSGADVYTAASYMGDDDKSRQLASGELEARVQLDNVLKGIFKSARIIFTDPGQTARAAGNPKNLELDMETYSDADIRDSARSQVADAGGMLLNHHVSEHYLNSDPDVLKVTTAIGSVIDSNPAEANRIRAAVAGSTLTTLSAAQSAALRNQMGRVRDHALQAGRLRCMGNYEATAQQRPCKNSHVWVEGTSFFSEQHSVGDESGYRLNSWGGALGIDAQVDAHWSVGVSLSASYGDLEARAADYAKGDLDTYTVSFWSQAKNGRWGNTLLFTLGTNEADLKRTVNYGAGSYTATSNTSGSSLGAMWELTYDLHPVKDNKSNILQPLFNVALTRTSMDGFSEKNAGNVGLTTEKQTRDTVTLGLGLRWLAAINSAKAVNRTVTTEVHANVTQDLGDRRSVANVALLADPSFTQNVYGSKAGSTAFQFGAGVNVPMTPNSQIYVNAGGELREHANAWNAALGVRMGF